MRWKGTIFIVTFPIRQGKESRYEQYKAILVIDDEPAIREALARLLEPEIFHSFSILWARGI